MPEDFSHKDLAPFGPIFRHSHHPYAAHLTNYNIKGKMEIPIQLN